MLRGAASRGSAAPVAATGTPLYPIFTHGAGSQGPATSRRDASSAINDPIPIRGRERFDSQVYMVAGRRYVSRRLVLEDNTNFDPDRATRKRFQGLQDDDDPDFYVDPYKEGDYRTVERTADEIRGTRDAIATALERAGLHVNRRDLARNPIVTSTGHRFELYGDLPAAGIQETPPAEPESAPLPQATGGWSRFSLGIMPTIAKYPVSWGAPPDHLVSDAKREYTMEHSVVRAFEIEMCPFLFMDPSGAESYMTIECWVERVTRIGVYYLGAEYVLQRDPKCPSRAQYELIFGVDPPDSSRDHPETCTVDFGMRVSKDARPWDPRPPITEEDKRKGVIDWNRVFIHCVFCAETAADSEIMTKRSRFYHYYYSN